MHKCLKFSLLLVFVSMTACSSYASTQASAPVFASNIPAVVRGTVTDLTCPRVEPVVDTSDGKSVIVKEAVYCMFINVNGTVARYPVSAETWAKSWTGDQVTLDCDPLPCVFMRGE